MVPCKVAEMAAFFYQYKFLFRAKERGLNRLPYLDMNMFRNPTQ
ncbi:hypothetical protein ABID47_001273 [Paenibacillus favisporus]|uniref:Uncharacterized protein n=1 Tax=Paenibacillus favisporus TaxID=221028 RepID=A0ABV2EYI3_9BACL